MANKKLSQTPLLTSLPAGTSFPVLLATAAQSDAALRNARGTEGALANALRPLIVLGPNLRPDLQKSVRWLTADERDEVGGTGISLQELLLAEVAQPRLFCVGTVITVENDSLGSYRQYRTVYDGAPRTPGTGLYVFATGHFTAGDLAPAKVVRIEEPAAGVTAYAQYPFGYAFATDQLIRAYVPGNAVELFFKRTAPGGAALAPSDEDGDANWELVGEQDVPTAQLTPSQLARVVALTSPMRIATGGGQVTPVALPLLTDFVANQMTDGVLYLNQGVTVPAGATVYADEGRLEGQGNTIAHFGDLLFLGCAYGVYRVNVTSTSGAVQLAGVHHECFYNAATTVPASSTAFLTDCSLADCEVAGTLRLGPGTETLGAITTIGSGQVIDERPGGGYIDPAGTIADAVAAGTFTNGELQGAQPAGSRLGMEFTSTTYGYRYQPGASGVAVWNRFPKA